MRRRPAGPREHTSGGPKPLRSWTRLDGLCRLFLRRRRHGCIAAADGLPIAWYPMGMRTTIDKAGRLVIPKPLRDQVGLVPGEVEVIADGAGLRVEPLAGDELVEEDGRLVIPAAGSQIDDDLVRALRDASQR